MQSVKSNLQFIFHQYDDIQELFFSGDVSSFDLNARDSHGKTLLHHACEYGLTEGVSILLANNAQADIRDEKGYTPLHYACQDNHIHYNICKILIEWNPSATVTLQLNQGGSRSGSTVSALSQDKHSRTVLHYACIHGDFVVADSLLKAGADPCVQDIHGNNPMHYACMYGHLENIRLFIANSQNPMEFLQVSNNSGCTPFSMKTSSGGTILHVACDHCDTVVVKILLKAGVNPDVKDDFGFTPLMRAVVSTTKPGITTESDEVFSIITALCNSKCSVNASFVPSKPSNIDYCEGSTALHMAIDIKVKDIQLYVQALVDNGAALDARDVHGRTPLHIASMWGHHRLIKLLAPTPESLNFKDNDGCTPLYYACKNSHIQCVRKINVQALDVFIDLMKVANNDGTTPLSVRTGSGGTILHVACDFGDINLVKKLLEAGADPNVTDMFGFTPLMRAVVSTSKSGVTTGVASSIITSLCNSKCSVNAPFVPSKPSDSNVHYCEGSTALHMAIDEWTDNQLCVRVLLDNGAALDARDVHGRTPLHIVSMRGHHHLIKLLAPTPESFSLKDNDGSTPLYYACKNSQLEYIKRFLIQTPSVISDLMRVADNDGTTPLSVRTGSGGTILHVACDKGDKNLVKMLLEAGADPNVTDEFGFTPLMRTVVSTSKSGVTTDVVSSIITVLCNGKCSVNASFVPSKPSDSSVQYCEGSTALHMAIDEWTVDELCVKALVENGASLDARDIHGRTPLHIASMCGYHHLIKLLASSPESSHFKDDDGCTPLYYACKNSHLECIRIFIVHTPGVIGDLMKVANNDGTTPLSVRTGSGGTILHVACDFGDINLVKKLLEAGADPNVTDEFGYTPLMRAVVSTQSSKSVFTTGKSVYVLFSIITALCNSKCSVNVAFVPSKPYVFYYEGSTALHMAIDGWLHDRLYIKLLIDNGAALDARDVHGCTPLHIASIRGHHSLIKLLASSPEFFHFKDNDGCTPVYYACKNAHIECIREFMVQIPDVINDLMKVADNDGTTPLSVRTVSGGTILHVACDKGDINLVKKLLEVGADPNETDEFGFTPLMRVVLNTGVSDTDVSSIVTIFCSSNCNVNATFLPCKLLHKYMQWKGTTALHLAVYSSTVRSLCVRALIDNGARLDVTDAQGHTPLHIAGMRGHQSFIKLLTPTIESFHLKDFDGCTPLYYACKNSHIECVREIMVQIPDDIGDLLKVANKYGDPPLSVRSDNDQTILHVACEKGDLSIVKMVLEAGADPTVTDKLGCTPLYYACKNSHLECVREFMVQIPDVICDLMKVANKYGATPLSVRANNDQTILHVACEKGDLSIVKKVLEAGADPNSRDGSTFTPLMLAVQYVDDIKAVDIVAILCEFKCNLNIQASHFSRSLTALHLACELGKETCVEILAAKGANILVRTKDGLTPLHLACKGGYHTFTSLLITEATLKARDYIRGWTPLHYACQYHHIECVKQILVEFSKLLLLTYKTYPWDVLPFHSLRNQDGRTILHHAFMRNDVQFVENLINLGADPNVQDNEGATPLMSALHCHGSDTDIDLLSLLLPLDWKPDIKDNSGRTALHYSAKCDDIRIPLMLISAGCDVTAVDNYGQTISDLISKESLQLINKQLLRIDRRQIICVVGYPKCGKTTIIAAFHQAQQNRGTFQRLTARFQNTRVTVPFSRTAGIDTKVITTKRLGSLIFFDFAGQSEYYASHLAFLESALSVEGSTITFIMMVDLRCSKEVRIAQCKEWLFPTKSILNDHNRLNVILIGSHLDQIESESTSTSSFKDTLRELKRTLGTPQMQFIDCWGMDCRQLSSKGITNLQNYLQATRPAHNTSAESSQVSLRACLLFDRLKKSENPPLAITPSKIIDNLKDGRPPFPLTVKYIDNCCQDLAASGLVLYIPNREDAGESWLILEMEEILSRIHGKLFAPDSAEFPMHHKNLANQFGLVHIEELTLAFKSSPLDPEMVQKLLMAMEFCHPVDSSLMTEGIFHAFSSKFSVNTDMNNRLQYPISTTTEKGLICNLHGNLLFFPSLVRANEEPVILSTESDIPGDDCHWVCWELNTVKPHFLHPRFQQAVFIRLACNHVQKHKADLGTVVEHSCTVSKNAMSWSTIHGVDVCVQIMHRSIIKVLARSRPGVKVSSLMEMFSSVVSDVLTVRANHAPGVDAYSVFRVMEKGTPGEHTVPVSSIIDVVQAGGMFVNSRERPPKLVPLRDLFLDWEISVTLLEKMVSIFKMNHDAQVMAEDVREETHSGPVMIEEDYYDNMKLILSDVYSALTTEDVVVSKWKLFAHNLKVGMDFIQLIEEACLDSFGKFYELGKLKECLYNVLEAWLSEEEGTGDLPRTWDTIVTALESCSISTLAESLRKQIGLADSNTPQDIGSPKLKSPSGDKEQRNTVHGPSPGPGKNSSKDAVTWRDNSSLPSSEQDVPEPLTPDNGDVESSHEQAVFDADMSPSDVGLQGILEMLPVWEKYAISLGLTIEQVEYYQGLQQRTIRGLLALKYWRDEQCGPSYPCTWRFLLDVIKDRLGPYVAEDLRKKVAADNTWTISSSTGNPPTSQANFCDDTDTPPNLLDDNNGNKDKLDTKSIDHLVRAQDEASESEVPQEEEESGSEHQLSQKFFQLKPIEAELVRLVGSQMCAKWNTFAVYLGIVKHIRDEVSYKCLREPKDCFIEAVGRWLSHEDGTGDSPRTWETVFSALQEMGFTLLVKEVTQKLSKRLETSQQ